jgi:hypothetical protein
MYMDRNFGGVIWTDHAMQRLQERGISQSDAWATWRRPDQTRKGDLHKHEQGYRYYKRYGDQIIEVVANQNEKKEWIIISVWSKPVFEKDKAAFPDKKPHGKSLARKLFELLFVKPENRK